MTRTARLVEAEFAQLLEDGVEDARLDAVVEQTLAKLDQHARVEAWIVEREMERVFPILPKVDVNRRLAVGTALQRFENQHKGEENGRKSG